MMLYESMNWSEPTDSSKTIERFFWFWENKLIYIYSYKH
jgi:hypothetical protein